MKSLKSPKSILYKLLIPILTATFLLLIFSAATLSVIYARQTEQSAIRSNLEILRQTDASMQVVHSHVSQILANIVQKPYLADILSEPMDNIQDEWRGRHQIGALFSDNPYAMIDYEILVFGANGFAVSSGVGAPILTSEEIMELPVFKKSLETSKIVYDSRIRGISSSTADSAVILGCRSLTKQDGTVYGGVIISIRESSLRKFYQNFINQSTSILLLSSDGTVLSSNILKDVGTHDTILLEYAQINRAEGDAYTRTEAKEFILSQYISYCDAYIISRITPAVLHRDFLPRIQTIAIILLTLGILLLSIFCIIRRNLLPLQKLADHMASVKDVPTPAAIISGSAELEMITGSYNKMTDTLHKYLIELNEIHEKQRQDELALLQMQINPHFLYNTLDSVKHLIEMHNPFDACQTIEALISLLRSTLQKTNMVVTVAEEVQNIRNYISIIAPRYGGLITADVFADPGCLTCKIPNLLLQPLVENSFFHAFQSTKKGQVRIFLSRLGDELTCEVIDNGDGMTEEQLARIWERPAPHQSVTSIGLANIRERLALLYPGKNSFQITSEHGYGTCVTISFPAEGCLPLN